jgi:hypothetical protein
LRHSSEVIAGSALRVKEISGGGPFVGPRSLPPERPARAGRPGVAVKGRSGDAIRPEIALRVDPLQRRGAARLGHRRAALRVRGAAFAGIAAVAASGSGRPRRLRVPTLSSPHKVPLVLFTESGSPPAIEGVQSPHLCPAFDDGRIGVQKRRCALAGFSVFFARPYDAGEATQSR